MFKSLKFKLWKESPWTQKFGESQKFNLDDRSNRVKNDADRICETHTENNQPDRRYFDQSIDTLIK